MENIYGLFCDQAERSPERIALRCGKDELTYAALRYKAEKKARLLLNKGVQPKDCVLLYMPESIDLVVSLLAILSVGAVVLPIDFEAPPNRVECIFNSSKARCIICRGENRLQLESLSSYMVMDSPSEENGVPPLIRTPDSSTAFCIYTSGSTAEPKGVLLSHTGILNHIRAKAIAWASSG